MTLDVALKHRFGDFTLDLAFAIEETGVTALFGPSGAGKSTVINAVAGLIRPDRGHIRINGATVFDSNTRLFLPPRRRRVGYVFQDARLFPHLSVERNLLFGWRRTGRQTSPEQITEIIDLLGLAHLLNRKPATLSGGEKQRVAIGRALMSGPDLLLLDEPLAALDQKRRGEILPYLKRLGEQAGIPMLYVSHAIDEVAALADRVVVMNKGQLVASGNVADTFARLDLIPITGRFDAGGVIEATVCDHDDSLGLTRLAFNGENLLVPRLDSEPGTPLKVRVRARDILIARDAPTAISANNILPARITEIHEDPPTYADIQLDLGATRLVARLTRASVDRLGLKTGMQVQAIIKSVTID